MLIRQKRAGLSPVLFLLPRHSISRIGLALQGDRRWPSALVPVSPQFPALSVHSPAEYNPHMRTIPAADVDAWLRAGGIVIAASDRAARAVRAAYHRARRAEGLSAWTAPEVFDWNTFARNEWESRVTDGRLVLNCETGAVAVGAHCRGKRADCGLARGSAPAAGRSGRRGTGLAVCICARFSSCCGAPHVAAGCGGLQRLAYQHSTRFATRSGLVSASRIPLELLGVLEKERAKPAIAGACRVRSPAAGTAAAVGCLGRVANRLSPVYRPPMCARTPRRISSWSWRPARAGAGNSSMRIRNAGLLVVVQDANQRRGEIERAFLNARAAI